MAAPRQTLERELKLGAGPGFRLPELPGERLEPRVFTSTYYDTADGRLARAGVTLRRRTESGRGLWQLKLPREAARLELELPGAAGAPPAEMLELLTAHVRGGELAPVARLRTRREGVRVRDLEGLVADVTVDSVAVLDGRRAVDTFRELEVELQGGDGGRLEALARALRDAGASDGDGRPKLFRALRIDPPSPPAPPPPDAPPLEHLRAALAAQLRAILVHDPGTRLGDEPEELHQLRVATRRARAFLRAARPLLDRDWAEGLRAELAWLGSALGPVRDLDVLLERLTASAASLEPPERRALRRLLDLLAEERESARAGLLDALRTPRYLALLDRLERAAESPRAAAVPPELSLRDLAAEEFRRLRKAVRMLDPEPSDEALHEVRIRGKRARYATELAEPAVGSPATRVVRAAKALQDVLGAHQDAVVAEERVRSLVPRAGGRTAAFAAGRLAERERARRREARAAFRLAWKRLARAGRAAWG